ncbi:MAG: DUF885 domain-containing protein [Deltaproteobacteria bacterium]|nr:DUF885 domain-containing protein [Deltaproteobacteria bacterium]
MRARLLLPGEVRSLREPGPTSPGRSAQHARSREKWVVAGGKRGRHSGGPVRILASLLALSALSALSTVLACQPAASSQPPAPNGTTKALHALFEEEWEHDLAESPTFASSIGERRFDDRWDDTSLAAIARREAHEREVLERVKRLDRAALSKDDALSYDLFRYRAEMAVEGQPFRGWLFPINQRGGVQTQDEIADELPFGTVKSYRDWNARLAGMPAYIDQTIEVLTEAIRTRAVHPRLVMRRVVGQLDAQIVDDPTKSPFFLPYKKADAQVPAAERERLAAEAKQRIADGVVPAYKKLRAFWVEKYLPACRDTVGAWDLPDGAARYAYAVRWYTTTKLTPDQVHATGLREVARIRGEMEAVKAKTGFTGSLKEFFAFLRSDKRFFFENGAQLLTAYRELTKKVDPELVKVFGKLPRTPYGVLPIPDATAPDTTTAYYRPPAADGTRAGAYFVNLYKPEMRPRWEMVSLTLHESVPGHHLQIALAMENEGIPKFRRHGEYTAYVEGWALYAESLGEEMGLYDDPYAKFGQLTYEMWRAVRLVVDTGIHHLKWDRQKAIDFFMENAAKAELDVVNEIDRYIVWPGQALAYKTGELRIKEMRKKKTAELGARFDLKKFHESVLRAGPLPLDLLEREVMEAKY